MSNNLYVDLDIVETIKSLRDEYRKLDDTYKSVRKSFDNIREAELEGGAATEMLEICDIWDKINDKRLEQVNDVIESLDVAYTIYNATQQNMKGSVS